KCARTEGKGNVESELRARDGRTSSESFIGPNQGCRNIDSNVALHALVSDRVCQTVATNRAYPDRRPNLSQDAIHVSDRPLHARRQRQHCRPPSAAAAL